MTYFWGHDDSVDQKLANGYTAVMRHCKQNEKFTGDRHKQVSKLCGTRTVGDCI